MTYIIVIKYTYCDKPQGQLLKDKNMWLIICDKKSVYFIPTSAYNYLELLHQPRNLHIRIHLFTIFNIINAHDRGFSRTTCLRVLQSALQLHS